MQVSRVIILNPNTNARTTDAMVGIARQTCAGIVEPGSVEVEGLTAHAGPAMIVTEEQLDAAAGEVAALIRDIEPTSSTCVIVSAFGDPGIEAASRRFGVRCIGIGAASMMAAGANGRRFAVATTTPGLITPIAARAAALGLAPQFLGTWVTSTSPLELANDDARTVRELAVAVEAAIAGGSQAVIIGGGPLALAARRLAGRFTVPLIEPVPCAVRALVTVMTGD